MPNPHGYNGLDSYTPPEIEIPYGQKQVDSAVQSLAPLAGQDATAHATNAPRRAQRHAVHGSSAGAGAAVAPTVMVPATPSVDVQIAEFWQGAASEPGASPLVQSIARDAARAAGGQ